MQIVTAKAGVLRVVPDERESPWWQGPDSPEPQDTDPPTSTRAEADAGPDAGISDELARLRAGRRLADQLRGALAREAPPTDAKESAEPDSRTGFRTGLSDWDDAAPGRAFAWGAVHELLFPPGVSVPRTPAALLAIAAARARGGWIAWSDPDATLYAPALHRHGLAWDRLLLIRPAAPADEAWAVTECLRCRGLSATVMEPGRLSRVEARRLQLAAERGGGAGIFLRPQRSATEYAAATRWLVRPVAGGTTVQRWTIELLHGHGGRIGHPVLLEVSRDILAVSPDAARANAPAHPVRSTPALGHRTDTPTGRATA
jgi:protein ImuA